MQEKEITLCVFSDTYDTFMEREISFWKKFKKVYFFYHAVDVSCSHCAASKISNIEFIPIPKISKSRKVLFLLRLKAISRFSFWTEFLRLFKSKVRLRQRISSLLNFTIQGEFVDSFVRQYLFQAHCPTNAPVCFYSYWLNHLAYAAVRLSAQFSKSFAISRTHRYDLYEYRNSNNYIPYRKLLLQCLTKIFSISQDGNNHLLQKYAASPSKLILSRLGSYDYGVNPIHSEDKFFRLVSCSYCVPVKRLDLLIKALSLLKIPVEWVHFGEGILRNDLIRQAKEILPSNIKYEFAGGVDNTTLMKWYSCHPVDAFINVSESEGIPVSIMEAISFGIPVFAPKVGGIPEIIHEQQDGFLFSSQPTAEEIADKLVDYYHCNFEEQQKMRKNARDFWYHNYNAEKNYKDFFSMICALAEANC